MLARSKNFPKRVIFLVLVLGIFLIFPIFSHSARKIITQPFLLISRPFFKISESLNQWWEKNIAFFKNKTALEEENLKLKEKISELELKVLLFSSLEKENEELKSLFSQFPSQKEKKYILAAIISRPPQSPYDILIVDAGTNNGVEKGMMAVAFDNVLLGYLIDVFPKTSKIKLISFPGEETNVMIESALKESKISAISIGRGGGNLEIKIPSSIEIHSGDRVMTMGTYSLMLGVVEKTEINLSDPFQKIFFRFPVNLQELKYLMIEK